MTVIFRYSLGLKMSCDPMGMDDPNTNSTKKVPNTKAKKNNGSLDVTNYKEKGTKERKKQYSPSNSKMTEAAFVKRCIAESSFGVVIFSKSWCPHCKKATKLIHKVMSSPLVKVHELDKLAPYLNEQKCQDALEKITGGRTVPRIFINGNFVSGGDDILKMHDRNDLYCQLNATTHKESSVCNRKDKDCTPKQTVCQNKRRLQKKTPGKNQPKHGKM